MEEEIILKIKKLSYKYNGNEDKLDFDYYKNKGGYTQINEKEFCDILRSKMDVSKEYDITIILKSA
jgi:hypothetical protein